MNNKEIEYWKTFYNKKVLSLDNSNFSIFVNDYIKNIINNNTINANFNKYNIKLLDIGCGNGKDTYYLSNNFNSTGIDSSFKPQNKNNCQFEISNFVKYDKSAFNIIYSRFTLHSITDDMQHELFSSIKPNTYLFIETRSDKGIDTKRVYGDEHYRNFTNFNKIKNMLHIHNFDIMYEYEGNNCALYKNEDPICIRLVCYKNTAM